jgi:pilus assembly protein CpaB
MNLARILVLVIALGAGGAAAYLALNLINQEPAPQPEQTATTETQTEPPVPTIETVDVLVATRDLPLGTSLDESSVTWRAWPSNGVADTYILRSQYPDAIADVAGTLARGTFYAGEPITQGKLARTEGGLLSAMLPAGMRAIALSIGADTSAGGFILPNDRVDVIMTRRVQNFADGAERYVTETILSNIRVLAIDQQVSDENGTAVVVGRTATLELTPLQAEILTVAQQIADRLTLSLRSLADADAEVAPDAVNLINDDTRNAGVTIVRNGIAVTVNPGQ